MLNLQRNTSLDSLRGLAILFVIFFHLEKFLVSNIYFFSGGFIGVDIFFIISGYILTHQAIAEKNQKIKINFTDFFF